MPAANVMTREEARAFAERWLPAWTGGDPERLAAFYTDDLSYIDPTSRGRLSGKGPFLAYMAKLLAANPDWVWRHDEAIPMEDGFLNHWTVTAPVGDRLVTCKGVCSVQLRDGLIYRNDVFFDPSPLLEARRALKEAAG